MVTISQIAAELGLSKATVSRALRGVPGVADVTVATVRAAAETMGYIPDVAAAGLATGRSRAVAVVVPSLSRWFYNSVLTGIDRGLRSLGYDTVLYDLDRSVGSWPHVFVRSDLRRRVDGLIAVSMMFSAEELAEFSSLDIPMIAVGPTTHGFRTIGIDDAAVMTTATEHVLALGHQELGYLGGFDSQSRSLGGAVEREHAFMTAALDAGAVVDPTWMLAGRYRQSIALEVVTPVFRSDSWPTALVCASDEMAIGAMYAIQAAGLRVPQDVSVIGVDGHEYAQAYDLTTCAQYPEAQGELAARQIIAEVEGGPSRLSFEPADYQLVVRGSTGPPRASR
ncbi:LacI family DNA-binding transcriptional regulator [Demequina sp.]|uniref:LacI family DNA-binding transcriptional regulator n=1 Tax=Demequina sp. TaxID=2050685 RepID=UPI0025D47E93|nr:LacI family DNA-binding transcriptional regulator [Demequina sp.]